MIKKIILKIDKKVFNGKLIKIYSKILNNRAKRSSFAFFNKKKNVVLKEPVYDMILMQYVNGDIPTYAFYDLAVRTLAIEEYYNKNTIGFDLYKKMHAIGGNYGQENLAETYYKKMHKKNKTPRHGAYPEQHSIEQFSSLIKSIDDNGYDENSTIMADRNLLSINGSHRIATSLYKGLDYIKVDVHNMVFNRRYTRDWFWINQFSYDEIMLLDKKMNTIINHCKQKIGCFYCILFPPAEDYFDDITKDISSIDSGNVELIKYDDFEWEIGDLKGFLRGVYYFDSIKTNDLIRKLFYIFNASKPVNGKVKFRLLSLKINSPMYRLKSDNGMPESVVTVRLKSIIRNRYKNKDPRFTKHYVGDYAHDVIIHSSDNYIQNKAFRELLSMPKDLSNVFSNIRNFKYVIATKSPDKISSAFPHNYYYYEDFDIFIDEKDLLNITETVYCDLLTIFGDRSGVVVSKETTTCGMRVRVTYNGFTLTMFDFMTSFNGIKQNAIKAFIEERQGKEYFFLSLKNEVIYRINKYLFDTNKQYHKEYIAAHRNCCKEDEIVAAFENNKKKQVKKILSYF